MKVHGAFDLDFMTFRVKVSVQKMHLFYYCFQIGHKGVDVMYYNNNILNHEKNVKMILKVRGQGHSQNAFESLYLPNYYSYVNSYFKLIVRC